MRLTPTFLDGALLAINAAPEILAVVDTHPCEMERAFKLDTVHDRRARTTGDGPYARNRRVFAIRWDSARDAVGTEEEIRELLLLVAARHPGSPILLLRGLVSMLIHTDLEGVAQTVSRQVPNPIRVIEQRSTDDDWIDGWMAVHDALLPLWIDEGSEMRDVVIGFAMHRLEGDEAGNVREMLRWWNRFGLPPPSWPLAGGIPGTERIHPEATRLIFPYGLGRDGEGVREHDLILDLPIGFESSAAFLRALGRLHGLESSVEEMLETERDRLRDLLQVTVSLDLAGRGAVVVGDPARAKGLAALLREIGMEVPLVVLLRRPGGDEATRKALETAGAEVLEDPEYEVVRDRLFRLAGDGSCDVVVGAGTFDDAADSAGLPVVETCFPQYQEHFIALTPFMGFEGLVRLADRISNAVARRREQWSARPKPPTSECRSSS